MLKFANPVVLAGTGYSRISRHSDIPLGVLAVDAAQTAANEAGVPLPEIDGLSVFPSTAHLGSGDIDGVDSVGARYMASALGLRELRWCVTLGHGSFIHSVVEAVNAVAAGACNYALVWRAMHNPPGKFGRYQSAKAEGEDQFKAPYGLADHISAFAFAYARYMFAYGARRDHLATFVVTNRRNAAVNPDAIFYQRPISERDYLESPMIVEPISLLDCDMPVDGCAAVIITTEDRAREAQHRPAYVLGYGSLIAKYSNAAFHTLEGLQESSLSLAKSLWASCGSTARDVDIANLYDGFSFFTYIWLEAFGFCKSGEAFQFIQDGRISTDGELPLNTSGGSLGMGRLHGPPQVIESVRQIQGRCGARQVADVNLALAVTGSPMSPAAMLIGRQARI